MYDLEVKIILNGQFNPFFLDFFCTIDTWMMYFLFFSNSGRLQDFFKVDQHYTSDDEILQPDSSKCYLDTVVYMSNKGYGDKSPFCIVIWQL